MAIAFRYSLTKAPEARNDGSGCVDHDIVAQYNQDGAGWNDVPGRHKTISIPFAEADLALGAGSNPQIVAAYKNALTANLDNQPVPITGWITSQLEALITANAGAQASADAVDSFITATLGQSYPVAFTL